VLIDSAAPAGFNTPTHRQETPMILPLPSHLAFCMPGGTEWIIILAIGLLIFGKRLPEVGRSLGKGIVEFKKGVRGIEDELDAASTAPPAATPAPPPIQAPASTGGDDLRVSTESPVKVPNQADPGSPPE